MTTVYGNASYYTSCNGSNGACAGLGCACDRRKTQLAWAHETDTGCNFTCAPIPGVSCCTLIGVYDPCTGNGYYGKVTDCCTCSPGGCNLPTCCNGNCGTDPNYNKPIADLTDSFFYYLHGSFTDGRIKVQITV